MGYLHISNLYKDITIMNFKECYALEKVHGTSAHIKWRFESNEISYASGGEKHAKFIGLFDDGKLKTLFQEHFPDGDVILFGEAYGGKQQGMSETYGKELHFIVFDVKIGETWLNVPNSEDVTKKMGLEFVPYNKIITDLEVIDKERDSYSQVAVRRGIKEPKIREGVVLRPLEEMTKSNGNRIIVKHKRKEFIETATVREVDPEKIKVIEEANAIADEWVTPMRLAHILDKLGNPTEIEKVRDVIKAMVEDVRREAEGEIVESRTAIRAISSATSKLYKDKISKIGV